MGVLNNLKQDTNLVSKRYLYKDLNTYYGDCKRKRFQSQSD